MKAEERREATIQIMGRRGFAGVEALAEALQVSGMTVRRDLQKLEEQKLIRRRHGGAALAEEARAGDPYGQKETRHIEGKRQIARRAVRYIQNGASLYLDGGTTTLQLARLLHRFDGLTVITNDLAIAGVLAKTQAELILLGGAVQGETKTVAGPLAAELLRQFSIQPAFFGASCVEENYSLSSPTIETALLERTALQMAELSFLLADESKFSRRSLARFGHLSDFSAVVTDRRFSPEELKELEKRRIHAVCVGNPGTGA